MLLNTPVPAMSYGSTLSIWPDCEPICLPSRYRYCAAPLPASTVKCQLPSLTLPGVEIPVWLPSQKWPYSLPSEPTYRTGIAPVDGFGVPGLEWPVLNSMPAALEDVLNHSPTDRVVAELTRLSGRPTDELVPLKDATVSSWNGPLAPSVTFEYWPYPPLTSS